MGCQLKVKENAGDHTQTVYFVDWENPYENDFYIAEEVTVPITNNQTTKRPDIVLYINGIAVAVLELKRSTVSMAEGIRQNLTNQKRELIYKFFSTIGLVMAGNDSERLRYGVINTPEKYYLSWKEEADAIRRPGIRFCGKNYMTIIIGIVRILYQKRGRNRKLIQKIQIMMKNNG